MVMESGKWHVLAASTASLGKHFGDIGFHLQVMPRGFRIWRLKSRPAGKDSFVTFGPLRKLAPAQARRHAVGAPDLLGDGIAPDPQAARTAKTARPEPSRQESEAAVAVVANARLAKFELGNSWLPSSLVMPSSRSYNRVPPRFPVRVLPQASAPASPPSMLKRKRRTRQLSVGSSAFAIAGSALTLVGWASGVRRLTDWFDHDISQLPNNAVGVIAGGVAILLLALGQRRASGAFALVTGLIGGATLLEHLTGINLGIDSLLLTHVWGHSATLEPGRMGLPGSTSLLLIGVAIFLSMSERMRGWAAAGGVLVITIAIVSIVGYAFRARLFYSLPHLTTIALQTAILILALGIALVAAIPDRLPTRLLIEDSAAALLVLSSLPGILLVPMLIGLLTQEGERSGLFDSAFATATMVLVLMLLLSALLWRTAEAVQRHERARRESREQVSAMLGSITDAFMTLDPEWRYVFVNDQSQVHWGLSREAMLGSTIWEKFPEAVGTEAHRQLHQAMERRTTVEYEYFHAPLNKWYGSRAYPTHDGGLAVYSRDISAEKANAQRLREQRELLRVTLASIGDAVIATDNMGRVTFLNPVAQQLTGWPEEEATGQLLETVFTIVNAQTGQTFENSVAKVLREGAVVGLGNQSVLVAKDGSQRSIDDSAAPIRDNFGVMVGVVLIFRDVTEQRHAEQKLRSSEARQRAILVSALDCIITMDHEGKVIEFNPAAEKTFGYRREELVGQDLAEFIIPPLLRERHRQGMAHYLATGEGPAIGRRLELPALHADGSEFDIELSITRIPTDGAPQFTAYLRNITASKRVGQQRNARLAVTQALSQAGDVKEGALGVLRAICENLGWDVGFFWTATGDGQALACLESWHRPDVLLAEFREESCSHEFRIGEGIPGRVFASGQPVWLQDLPSEPNLPRAAPVAKFGLHSAFASPIMVGDQTLGVIEFFTRRIREADAGLLELMGTVSGSVGQFIQRRRAQDERSASADRLNLALSAADLGDWSWDAGSDMVTLSDRAADAFGIPSGPHMTWTAMQELVDPADQQRVSREVERVLAERVQYDIEYLLNRRNGTQAWVGVLGRANYDGAGRVVGMYGVVQDITERKGLEASLRSSEERLRLALDAGRMGVWDWNVRTGELNWSDTLEPLHGLAPGMFDGTLEHFQQLIHPEDRELVDTSIRQALDSAGEFYVEFRNVWENGDVHWIAGSGKVFPGNDGKPLRMLGIGLDVTKRRRAEQTAHFLADASAALTELADRDSTLKKVSSLAVPLFADWATVDLAEADGSLLRVSVSHIDPAKLQLAHELHRRFPPDPSAPQGICNILRTGRSEIVPEITDEMLVQSINDDEQLGIIRELGLKSYIGVPLKVRGDTLAVITFVNAESGHRYDDTDLAVAEDLASRVSIAIENAQLYRELRDADLRKDEFLATLAHELRNPLAPIGNALQVLRLSGGSGAMDAEARAIMERQLSQMVRLVDDLLDVSRITQNKLELRKERVSLASIVNSAVETSGPLMTQAGHSFSVKLPPTPVHLDADPVRLAQVFSNLLNNAAKYTEPGGRISLTAESSGSDVVVEVCDNGLGIPADAMPRVFKMFSQVDRNMERAQGGLGIGLSLVLRLVELHGGTIEARSDGPGRGSQFVVRLPIVSDVQPAKTAAGDGGLPETAKRRVLVVDDNHDSAWSLRMMLELMGNETHTAYDGLAAVAAAEEFLPDLILLDIGLPHLNGYDACRRIREQPWSEGMVIVALTGWGQDEDRRRSQEAGFDQHLVKPVDIVELNRLLTESTR
jgi:PAS domain S-box-containing protein